MKEQYIVTYASYCSDDQYLYVDNTVVESKQEAKEKMDGYIADVLLNSGYESKEDIDDEYFIQKDTETEFRANNNGEWVYNISIQKI